MKKTVWIRISGFPKRAELLATLAAFDVDPAEGSVSEVFQRTSWEGRFDSSDPRWRRLKASTELRGFRALWGEQIEYSQAELETAELLLLQLPGVTSKGDSGPEHGNVYDFSPACPRCLSGAQLIPPFRFLARDLPSTKPVAETARGEVLVGGDLAKELAEISHSDDWLIGVTDRRYGKALEWKLMVHACELPRWDSATRGMKRQVGLGPKWDSCEVCGRDWHGPELSEAIELVYRRSEILRHCEKRNQTESQFPDVCGTWERMGPGTRNELNTGRQIAQPYLIISQRVARVVASHASKWVHLTPITLL